MAGFGGAPNTTGYSTGGGAYVGASGPKNVGIGATGYTGPDPEQKRREARERAAAESRAEHQRRARQQEEDSRRQRRDEESRRESERQRTEMEARMTRMTQSLQPLGGGGAPAGGIPLGSPGAITGGPGGASGGIAGFQAGGGMQSNVGAEPEIQKYRDELGSQLEELKQPSDPSRERGLSATRIAGAQAGQEAQLEEEMAGRGLDTRAGIGGELARRGREGAQTDIAMAGAGIDMAAEEERKRRLDDMLKFGTSTSGMPGEAARAGQYANIAGYTAQTGRRAQDVTMRGQDINARLGQMGMWANLLNA